MLPTGDRSSTCCVGCGTVERRAWAPILWQQHTKTPPPHLSGTKPGRCVFAAAAGSITCSVTASNTGTVRLTNIHLTGLLGPACATVAVLLPGENTTCEVHKAVVQGDFDSQEAGSTTDLALPVTATGSSNVTQPALVIPSPATTFAGLQLAINRSLEVTASLSKDTVISTRALRGPRALGLVQWHALVEGSAAAFA